MISDFVDGIEYKAPFENQQIEDIEESPKIWIQKFLGPKICYKKLEGQESDKKTPLLELEVVIAGQAYRLATTKANLIEIKDAIEQHFDNSNLGRYFK